MTSKSFSMPFVFLEIARGASDPRRFLVLGQATNAQVRTASIIADAFADLAVPAHKEVCGECGRLVFLEKQELWITPIGNLDLNGRSIRLTFGAEDHIDRLITPATGLRANEFVQAKRHIGETISG